MKKFFIVILFLFAGAAQAQTVSIPISKVIQTRDGKQFYVHTVQNGQTVYSIAKAYDVAINKIYFYNPSARTGILVGQRLLIPDVNQQNVASMNTPSKKKVTPKNFDFFYHVASAGETIDHIASIYLIPKKYILLANPGLKGPLKAGEFVKIPVEAAYKTLEGQANGNSTSQSYSGGLNPSDTETNNLPVEKVINNMENSPSPQVQGNSHQNNNSYINPASRIPIIKNYRHVTMNGETMASIARKYKISVAELKAVNPGVTSVYRGEQLRLPVNAKVAGYHPSKAEVQKAEAAFHRTAVGKNRTNSFSHQQTSQHEQYIVHIVKKKETLYSISRKYGVSLNDLYKANKNLTTAIKIGQRILIPKKKINNDYVVYSPVKKIKLKKVAKLYGISYQKVKQNNPSIRRFVFPGELVKIPSEKTARVVPLPPGVQESTPRKTVTEKTEETPIFTSGCTPSIHNKTFNVALMVPLYLGQTDSLNRIQFMMQPQEHFEPFRFVQFLEGALLASQSLKARGMDIKLHVYDVDQDVTKTAKVISRPELRNMNLIIGPFYSRSFHEVALFAGHFHIPIVNPLTFRESVVTDHNGVMKVKPGFSFEPGLIKDLVKHYFSNDKVFIIKPSAFTNIATVDALRDSVQEVLPDSVKFANSQLVNLGIAVTQRERVQEQKEVVTQLKAQKESEQDNQQDSPLTPYEKKADFKTDSLLQAAEKPVVTTINDTLRPYFLENQFIQPDSLKTWRYNDSTTFANDLIQINYMQDSLHPLLDNASVLRPNLVIVYGNNKAYVMDVMNKLIILRDTLGISMIGLPAWENIPNLDDYQMSQLNVTYPASYYVNYDSPKVKGLDSTFVKYFGTVPQKYGFLGYDITYYFLNALYHYGNQMERCLPTDPYRGISTEFKFVPAPQNDNSYVNKYWNILQIKNMHLNKLPDSTIMNHPQWPNVIQSNDSIQ